MVGRLLVMVSDRRGGLDGLRRSRLLAAEVVVQAGVEGDQEPSLLLDGNSNEIKQVKKMVFESQRHNGIEYGAGQMKEEIEAK